jgi:hypothetical protein
MDLSKLNPSRKTGSETFRNENQHLQYTVADFWRWAFSDLVDNTTRGAVAEYIVALALGVADGGIRVGWSAYDLTTNEGVKVEVKSASYIQSWGQKQHSSIKFRIPPTYAFDDEQNIFLPDQKRQADVYVFALLHHREKGTVDPLNVEQWTFHILATSVLNAQIPLQKDLALSRLLSLEPITTSFNGIAEAISSASQPDR